MMLSKRLASAANMLRGCDTIYDIGSDHGLLPVYMLKFGLCQNAVLVDISAPAIERGRENIMENGLEDRAWVLVSDGLTGLAPRACDAVSVCGMGGLTALGIIKNGAPLPCPVVVQPNTDQEFLRAGLCDIGLMIDDEDIVHENGRYYMLIRAVPGQMRLTELDAYLGPVLLQKRSQTLYEYVLWQKSVFEKAGRFGGSPETTRHIALIDEAIRNYFT